MMFERTRRLLAGLALAAGAVVLGGCAHPITLAPDLAKVTSTSPKIAKTAGFYISAEDKAREVTTPGGGGDKVSYFPYRELEPGIYKVLSETFADVVRLDKPNDPAAAAARSVNIVITPKINTTSASDSAFTWPPTEFTVEFDVAVTDVQGRPVTNIKVLGQGKAPFSEFKADFSLSAKRASDDALAKLLKALSDSPELRK
ncbi:MAG: hypothetical protein EPO12_16445 [Aquabacterium sp.]|nr:MAG: hypothetical protein EPO12_16445 [Aquabacterium sp.]